MNILELADILDKQIEITYYPNQNCRFAASFAHCETKETKDSGVLCSNFGDGNTPTRAINNYAAKISGSILVFDAMTDDRAEFKCPELAHVKED